MGQMVRAAKNLIKLFARVSPCFVLLWISASTSILASGADRTASIKRQAEAQFQRAEQQRATLNLKPTAKRTLGDYRQVVSSYRRVYLITPRANEVPDALIAVSQLYTEMGEHFGSTYYQSAVDTYRFLISQYPGSRHGSDAMMACAKIQRDQLSDYSGAAKTYQEFLKRYPRSSRKREAQEGVAELALLRNGNRLSAATETKPTIEAAASDADATQNALATQTATPPASGMVPRLRRIRTSAEEETSRVTIDLEGLVPYTSGRLTNPDRIFFDLHNARLPLEVARQSIEVDGDLLTAVRTAQYQASVVRVVLTVDGVKEYAVSTADNPPQLLIDLYAKPLPAAQAKAAKASHNSNRTPALTAGATGEPAVEAVSTSAKAGKTASQSEAFRASTPPQPTRDGQSTLTRALGLKIGRIVIDAGHGGHDTGTIGPTGLMEKDLCLDVALRLGKIIKQRLPGAAVVFTRSDDSFIPLEERTAIANDAHADLFISVHANSSQDHAARGIETYYLNLKGSPEAMEVAARENAVSDVGIHDLEDLIKKITRNEKIDESREFAEDIQNSLSVRMQKTSKLVKNRGVRKAPFVVLIGADMPSILTEISFLSNPADEQLLKKPEHRQRVAEGLYQGVASYLQSLNSVAFNVAGRPEPSIKPTASRSKSAKLQRTTNEE